VEGREDTHGEDPKGGNPTRREKRRGAQEDRGQPDAGCCVNPFGDRDSADGGAKQKKERQPLPAKRRKGILPVHACWRDWEARTVWLLK
jgi:hypothetical protein